MEIVEGQSYEMTHENRTLTLTTEDGDWAKISYEFIVSTMSVTYYVADKVILAVSYPNDDSTRGIVKRKWTRPGTIF